MIFLFRKNLKTQGLILPSHDGKGQFDMNYNMNEKRCQMQNFEIGVVLTDKKSNGKERPWKEHKLESTSLGDSYGRLFIKTGFEKYLNRHHRCYGCGSYLEFRLVEDGLIKLKRANFCQIPLCPMCAWRRSLKLSANVGKAMKALEVDGYRFIFLTLTVESVTGKEVLNTMDKLCQAFNRLSKYKMFKDSVKGWFRALEVTHDTKRKITKTIYKERKEYYDNRNLKIGDVNPNFDTYHPHFHVMLAVNKSYFKKKSEYITHEKWVNMWQKALKVEYTPIVNVKAVKDGNGGSAREVAKYSVKSGDYLVGERDEETKFLVKVDEEMTDDVVAILTDALHKRRLVGWGGICDEKRKELDIEADVLADVNIDGGNDGKKDEQEIILIYRWFGVGFMNYKLTEIRQEVAEF